MQALDEDQPGSKVMYKKLFEEDREYNQGTMLVTVHGMRHASVWAASCLLIGSVHTSSAAAVGGQVQNMSLHMGYARQRIFIHNASGTRETCTTFYQVIPAGPLA